MDIIAYSITSASGALSPQGWQSLQESGEAGADWAEANPNANGLSELNPSTSSLLTTGTVLGLGSLFTPGSEQDLIFQYATAGGELLLGTVEYGELSLAMEFLAADFNKDGTVNLEDFNTLKSNFGSTDATMATGDTNMDGVVNLADFNTLKNQFGQSSSAAVPEPGSWLLMILAGIALLLRKSGRKLV